MKSLSIIAVLFLSVVLFSCGNTENKTNGEATNKEVTNDKGDFESFWTKFQSAVAANDKEAVFALANEDVKSYIQNYDFIFDEKMKSEIANTKASDIKVISDEERLFQYIIEYPSDESDPNAEVFESSFGFVIGKVDGKWLLTVPSFAG